MTGESVLGILRAVAMALLLLAVAPGADADTVEMSVAVDPAGEAPVVEVARGDRLRLSIEGAGGHELHLHGYDISVEAGAPAVFEFDALHSGRFAIVAHGVQDLLGRGERPIAFIEVREK